MNTLSISLCISSNLVGLGKGMDVLDTSSVYTDKAIINWARQSQNSEQGI